MFPIGDSPNPRGLALVTLILIGINVLVYVMLMPQMSEAADPADPRFREYVSVLQAEGGQPEVDPRAYEGKISEYDLTVFEHGSRPAHWTWLSMLTSMFLHGGFMHLFGNMLFLWIYGNNIEHRLGRLGYLVAYLGTGFIASFGDIALRPDSNIPGVGASGAISGVLGMYFICFPKNQVKLLLLIPPVVRVVDVGARWVLGFYIVAQNILPAFLGAGGGGGGVAYGAHIGGFIGGILAAFVTNWRLKRWPKGEGGPEEGPSAREMSAARDAPGGLLGTFREELHQGQVEDASRLFFGAPRELSQAGAELQDAVALGAALEARGEARGALAAYERGIALEPQGPLGAAAHLGAARVLVEHLRQPTMAYQHVVAAVQMGPAPEQIEEARRLLGEIQGQVGSLPRHLR